ncbi:class F sortase [Thermopolyspora sp. NPDC052614]|uniref:class F sortase n=1 Tax=Thermopolyspora sp. NPDC052614 TaxID=3155682 RepID=UPI003434AF75
MLNAAVAVLALAGIAALTPGAAMAEVTGGAVRSRPDPPLMAEPPFPRSPQTRSGRTDADQTGTEQAGIRQTRVKRARSLRMGFAIPTRIRIPSIGVDAPLVKIGLDRRGRLQPPPLHRAGVAGWYVGSASPGQIGPAVVTGHMDTRTGPAVFYRLRQVRNGARVYVDRRDGSTAVFAVRKRIRVPKTSFPTDRVYGDIGKAGLRIITCGGPFDNRTHHYRDNLIVFAQLVRAINSRAA